MRLKFKELYLLQIAYRYLHLNEENYYCYVNTKHIHIQIHEYLDTHGVQLQLIYNVEYILCTNL